MLWAQMSGVMGTQFRPGAQLLSGRAGHAQRLQGPDVCAQHARPPHCQATPGTPGPGEWPGQHPGSSWDGGPLGHLEASRPQGTLT